MKQAATFPFSRLQHGLMTTARRQLCLLIVTVCLILAQPFPSVAQTNAPAPLPPAAQEALDKGIIAAKVPDYLLAIRYFEEARKLAPEAPVVYLNLGLAESRIPGRELRAMAWFGAYLAAYPDAPNAAAVKKEISVLEVRNQSNVSRMIQTLQDSTIKPGSSKEEFEYDSDKLAEIARVAKLWADSGDIHTALRTALLAGNVYGSSAQVEIAAAQARAGDIASALKTAGIVELPNYRHDAFLGIAAIQLERGDLNGAETTIALARRVADQLSDGQTKVGKLTDIAKLQIKAGKMDGAQATLRAALTAVESIVIPTEPKHKDVYISVRASAQASIADAQIAAGDVAGAKQSLALAFSNSELIGDPDERAQRQYNIFYSYAKAGDVGNAIKTLKAYQKSADLITDANRKRIFTDSSGKDVIQRVLADAQLKAGDFNGALKTVNDITDVGSKWLHFGNIINAQVKAGDYRGAVKTNGEISDAEKRSYNLWQIVKAQAEARDFDGAAKNADLIQSTKYKEWAGDSITREKAKANNPVVPAPTPKPTAAKPSPVPAVMAADWIRLLDDNSQYGVALNTEPFLNFAGYLKSLPPSNNPRKVFEGLRGTAEKITKAQNVITGMLKQQTKR